MVEFFIYMAVIICVGMAVDTIMFKEDTYIPESLFVWTSAGLIGYILEEHFIIECLTIVCACMVVRFVCWSIRKQN